MALLLENKLLRRSRRHRYIRRLMDLSILGFFLWIGLFFLGLLGFGLLSWIGYKIELPRFLFNSWFVGLLVMGGSHTILRLSELSCHVPEKLRWYEKPEEALRMETMDGHFVLYLRNVTFDQLIESEVVSQHGVSRAKEPRPIESALRMASESVGLHVVALWSPIDENTHPAFEYLCVLNGDWEHLVEGLIARATCIVIVLHEETPGVLFESTILANSKLLAEKTLLLAVSPSDLALWHSKIPGLQSGCVVPSCLLDSTYRDGALDRDVDNRTTASYDLSGWLEGGLRSIIASRTSGFSETSLTDRS